MAAPGISVEFAGVGRTVEEDWLAKLKDNFSELTGDIPASLVLFERPGVYYADRDNINTNLWSPNPVAAPGVSADDFIEALIERGTLEEDAVDSYVHGVPVKSLWLDFDHPKTHDEEQLFMLFASLTDIKDLWSRKGFQLLNERNAVREDLDMPLLPYAENRLPRHTLKLGGIACGLDDLGDHFFEELRTSMGKAVDLAGVEEIVPNFRSTED